MSERLCPVCGEDLSGHRADAQVCSARCRRQRSRTRRLSAGEPDGRYLTLGQYENRPRRRAQRRS